MGFWGSVWKILRDGRDGFRLRRNILAVLKQLKKLRFCSFRMGRVSVRFRFIAILLGKRRLGQKLLGRMRFMLGRRMGGKLKLRSGRRGRKRNARRSRGISMGYIKLSLMSLELLYATTFYNHAQ